MIYLQMADLVGDSYERFITESTADDPTIIDKQEKRAIELAKTYLAGRYDTDKIFSISTPVVRNELLVDILVKIVLKKIFGRNSARKLPEDIKADHDWAIKELQRINSGATILSNLPKPQDESGNPVSTAMYGNTKNIENYI